MRVREFAIPKTSYKNSTSERVISNESIKLSWADTPYSWDKVWCKADYRAIGMHPSFGPEKPQIGNWPKSGAGMSIADIPVWVSPGNCPKMDSNGWSAHLGKTSRHASLKTEKSLASSPMEISAPPANYHNNITPSNHTPPWLYSPRKDWVLDSADIVTTANGPKKKWGLIPKCGLPIITEMGTCNLGTWPCNTTCPPWFGAMCDPSIKPQTYLCAPIGYTEISSRRKDCSISSTTTNGGWPQCILKATPEKNCGAGALRWVKTSNTTPAMG